jgi:hypothetical protein
MAKRFFSTNIHKDSWIMEMPINYRFFWVYLLAACDNAGIWEVNFKEANLYCDEIDPVECEKLFKSRIQKIRNGQYWFIPKFIFFQYGDKLKSKVAAQASVIKGLMRFEELHDFLWDRIKDIDFDDLSNSLLSLKDIYIYKITDKDENRITNINKELEEYIDGNKGKKENASKEKRKQEFKTKRLRSGREKKKNHPMLTWIDENTPRVAAMSIPLDAVECERILEVYEAEQFKNILLDMENWANLTNYESAGTTARQWLRRQEENDVRRN